MKFIENLVLSIVPECVFCVHDKFACLGILLVLPACALGTAAVCGLCVCGGVPHATAAAGTNPVTVSGTDVTQVLPAQAGLAFHSHCIICPLES